MTTKSMGDERPSDAEVDDIVSTLRVCNLDDEVDVVCRLLAHTKRLEDEAIRSHGMYMSRIRVGNEETLKAEERAEAAEKRVAELEKKLSTQLAGERRTWFEIEAKWGDDWVVPSWENDRELPCPLTLEEAREQLAAHQAATKYPFLRIVEVTRRTLDTTDTGEK